MALVLSPLLCGRFGYSDLKGAAGVCGGCGQTMGIESTFACNMLKEVELEKIGQSRFRTIRQPHDVRSIARAASAAPAASLCAGHVQPLRGASPLPDLMEVRVSNDARAIAVRRGLKEAWSKCASRWTRTGYKA